MSDRQSSPGGSPGAPKQMAFLLSWVRGWQATFLRACTPTGKLFELLFFFENESGLLDFYSPLPSPPPSHIRALGVRWNVSSDTFGFAIVIKGQTSNAKRYIVYHQLHLRSVRIRRPIHINRQTNLAGSLPSKTRLGWQDPRRVPKSLACVA